MYCFTLFTSWTRLYWICLLLVRRFGHFATFRLQRHDVFKTRAEISNQKTCSTIRQPRFDFLLRNRSKRPSLFGRVSLELSDSRRRPFHPEHKGQNDRGRQNVEGQSSSHLVGNADSEQCSRALVSLWLFDARYIVTRPPFFTYLISPLYSHLFFVYFWTLFREKDSCWDPPLTLIFKISFSGSCAQQHFGALWHFTAHLITILFILKGFLGTERQFSARYSRPIIASRGTGTSTSVSRESQEAGALAMEALHRQVAISLKIKFRLYLPFKQSLEIA